MMKKKGWWNESYLKNSSLNKEGLQKAIVVCHDWGGVLAWYPAGKYFDVVLKKFCLQA
ncbi:epoxide hydrolase 1-like isoform X1 [Tachypleus tridentatus]|uniref:epoxide hydrolase 1-like isoform X1 n=1 Tax=Tachypleus tridentatus TaxID=6853 RepID=UPI003FD5D120